MNLKNISCVMCGAAVRSVPALEPGGGQQLSDALWLCGTHRTQMKSLLGEVVGQSPGRPPKPPDPVKRARALAIGHKSSRWSQAPPVPRMPRPGSSPPTAPSMPRPGPG